MRRREELERQQEELERQQREEEEAEAQLQQEVGGDLCRGFIDMFSFLELTW